MRVTEQFIREIKDMMREVRELKGVQFIGRDSILGYRKQGAGNFDLSTSLSSGQTHKDYLVTFTHASAKKGALIEMHSFVSQNSNVLANYIPPWANGANVVLKVQKLMPHGNTKTQWYLTVINGNFDLSAVNPIYVKLLFEGMDNGSFSISAI